MEKIFNICKSYEPYNEQERVDKILFMEAFNTFSDLLTRGNRFCHFTSSAFILNQTHEKVLCCFHKIYKSWGWLGGHMDGMDDPITVAQKEAYEEAGVQNLKLLYREPIALDTLLTDGHFKNGQYVSSHLHLNLCYLFEANDQQDIRLNVKENAGVDWIKTDELIKLARESRMKEVYTKIIDKIEYLNILHTTVFNNEICDILLHYKLKLG